MTDHVCTSAMSLSAVRHWPLAVFLAFNYSCFIKLDMFVIGCLLFTECNWSLLAGHIVRYCDMCSCGWGCLRGTWPHVVLTSRVEQSCRHCLIKRFSVRSESAIHCIDWSCGLPSRRWWTLPAPQHLAWQERWELLVTYPPPCLCSRDCLHVSVLTAHCLHESMLKRSLSSHVCGWELIVFMCLCSRARCLHVSVFELSLPSCVCTWELLVFMGLCSRGHCLRMSVLESSCLHESVVESSLSSCVLWLRAPCLHLSMFELSLIAFMCMCLRAPCLHESMLKRSFSSCLCSRALCLYESVVESSLSSCVCDQELIVFMCLWLRAHCLHVSCGWELLVFICLCSSCHCLHVYVLESSLSSWVYAQEVIFFMSVLESSLSLWVYGWELLVFVCLWSRADCLHVYVLESSLSSCVCPREFLAFMSLCSRAYCLHVSDRVLIVFICVYVCVCVWSGGATEPSVRWDEPWVGRQWMAVKPWFAAVSQHIHGVSGGRTHVGTSDQERPL